MGYQPYQAVQQIQNSSSTINGSISAINQSVLFNNVMGASCWSVQTVGTFVGQMICESSLDGINYVPVAYRQSQTGTISNTIRGPGLFRGVLGGVVFFRVRATSWTSGTATVYIAASTGSAAQFPNALIETRTQAAYATSAAGGNTGFAMSSGEVSINNTGGPVAIFMNPANSGVDMYVNTITISGNKPGRWERIRGVTVNATGNSIVSANRGGALNTSPILYYSSPAASYTGGTLAETIYLNGFQPHVEYPAGEAYLRPGNATAFAFYPDNTAAITALKANYASVSLTYWLQNAPTV